MARKPAEVVSCGGGKRGEMAIIGAHMLIYSSQPDEARALLRDVFGFPSVDAGDGWLIFRLPPAELGVHPGEGPNFESGMRHEISFMCDDIYKTVAELRARGVVIEGEPARQSYGIIAKMVFPGGPGMYLYQPLHATMIDTNRRIAIPSSGQ